MSPDKPTAYVRAIKYLETFIPGVNAYQKVSLAAHPHPEMYLERMQDFLNRIGNPEKGFKYIHITGTSGKGSVSSLIHSTLVAKGKSAGLFTSPFVVSTVEKIQVGEEYIDAETFATIVESLKPHIDAATLADRHGPPSYFELILAIALLYFKQRQCEYVVLEVGLGGRYDATNIIEKPLITAITNIGLDHTQILGKTKTKIAGDKAGIIKRGSRFFSTESNPRLLSIFKRECKRVGASYNQCAVHGLDYQQRNKLLAAKICIEIGIIQVGEDIAIPDCLPARFEVVEREPLVIIDGAHNAAKMQSTVDNLKKRSYRRLFLVIAISGDKNWKAMLKPLLAKVHTVHVTRFAVSVRSCVNPKELFEFARKNVPDPKRVHLYTDPLQAFSEARRSVRRDDALLVTGSFYLAGDIRSLYCPEERVLKQRNSKLLN